jgi:hypothetical protein
MFVNGGQRKAKEVTHNASSGTADQVEHLNL